MASSSKLFIIIMKAIVLALFCLSPGCDGRLKSDKFTNFSNGLADAQWAVLVAGSRGFVNYRHQADICHAYQLLTDKGVPPENIIVFMYDDIAYDVNNPNKGVLINYPDGQNVYEGVVKDYTGDDVNLSNLEAVLLNQGSVTGGSGKRLNSNEHENIFFYFSGHGGTGFLELPDGGHLTADHFMQILEKMYYYVIYNNMLIYIDSCHSGSMAQNLKPEWNIYAVTASRPDEDSQGTYCRVPGQSVQSCLGDVFSVNWMEDNDGKDLKLRTVGQQFDMVKALTLTRWPQAGSHVMEYGYTEVKNHTLSLYMGPEYKMVPAHSKMKPVSYGLAIKQEEVEIYFYKWQIESSQKGSNESAEAIRKLDALISQRRHVDQSMQAIFTLLVGEIKAPVLLKRITNVHDWNWGCVKAMWRTFELYCGPLESYGLRHYNHAFANLCTEQVHPDEMAKAAAASCS